MDMEHGETALPYVVGIGASAGGLEALQDFFRTLDPNLPASYVVIQHLSPDYRSLMDELLRRCTSLPVSVAQEQTTLERGQVYLIPPGQNLTLVGRKLHLSAQQERGRGHLNFPIDLFFSSLAESAGERCVAIILSGTGSDGSRGIRAVSEAGGIVMAQDPSSTAFGGMVASAIHTGLVDVVADAPGLASTLSELLLSPLKVDPSGDSADSDDAVLAQILKLIRDQLDVDFREYKAATLLRRVQRRAQLAGCASLKLYHEHLLQTPGEQTLLLHDLLIGVTQFFRDPQVWTELAAHLDAVVEGAAEDDELRAWVCGCSTGEEAYTVAMLLHEALERAGSAKTVRVFATDVSQRALEFASAGVYPQSVTQDVSPQRLHRFFERFDEHYRVKASIRRAVVMAPHDIARQPPFSRMHLVSCRNTLIYFEPSLQRRALAAMHYALKPNGLLLLGSAEGVGELADVFTSVDARSHIFRKNHNAPLLTPTFSRTVPPAARAAQRASSESYVSGAFIDPLMERGLSALLSAEDAVGLVVSSGNRLLHIVGKMPPYLRMRVGQVTAELPTMLPQTLSMAVSTGLYRARTDRSEVWFREIQFGFQDETRCVDLQILPLTSPDGLGDSNLVVIRPCRHAELERAGEAHADEATQSHMAYLEAQLRQTQHNLNATIEELQTTNEEQQATNEELVASNEELQSTNEELHSVNEELHTVNREHQVKIEELTHLTTDLDRLLDSVDAGVLFLDGQGRVRRFNQAALALFRLQKVDEGRRLLEIADELISHEERAALHDALLLDQTWRGELRSATRSFSAHLHTLDPSGDATPGHLLTFSDITQIQRTRQALEQSEARFRRLAEGLPDALFVLDRDGTLEYLSPGSRAFFGLGPAEMTADPEGRRRSFHEGDLPTLDKALEAARKGEDTDVCVRMAQRGGPTRWTRARYFPVRGAHREILSIVGSLQDVTASVETEERLRQTLEQYKTLTTIIGKVVYRRDLVTGAVVWNGDHDSLLGYTEDTIGATQASWQQRIHPDDAEAVRQGLEEAVHSQGIFDLRYRFRRADGAYLWFRDRGQLTLEGGRPVLAVGAMRRLDETVLGPETADAGARAGLVQEVSPHAIWSWRRATREWEMGDTLRGWLGLPGDRPITTSALIPTREGGRSLESALEALARPGARLSFDLTAGGRDGDGSPVTCLGVAVADPLGRMDRVVGIAVSGAHSERRLALVKRDADLWARLFDALPMAVAVRDPRDRVVLANQTASAEAGADLVGEAYTQHLGDGSLAAEERRLTRLAWRSQSPATSLGRPLLDGAEGPRYVDQWRIPFLGPEGPLLASLDQDATERWERLAEVEQRAQTDALTSLVGKQMFVARLEHATERCRRRGSSGIAVLFMDLDGFKEVNDSYGHVVGDRLLIAFAGLLRASVRPGDSVARFGGDEFAVLLDPLGDYRDALTVANRIHEATGEPIPIDDMRFFISTSIGIAVYDPARGGALELLRDADVAMYDAKASGKGGTSVFNADMHAVVLRRLETKNDLREAIHRQELRMYLQPIFSGDDRRCVGAEALIRWEHPTRGLLTPDRFLGIAAEAQFMEHLEVWMFERVLAWIDESEDFLHANPGFKIALNMSPGFLRSPKLGAWIERIYAGEYCRRVTLMVEITESALVSAGPTTWQNMERLRAVGVQLALDDFGTGYSSLSYLYRFPIDVLKIDRSFTSKLSVDRRTDVIVEAIVDLGHRLGLSLVLEGVETEGQLAFAASRGVNKVQGYLLGKPDPAEAFAARFSAS